MIAELTLPLSLRNLSWEECSSEFSASQKAICAIVARHLGRTNLLSAGTIISESQLKYGEKVITLTQEEEVRTLNTYHLIALRLLHLNRAGAPPFLARMPFSPWQIFDLGFATSSHKFYQRKIANMIFAKLGVPIEEQKFFALSACSDLSVDFGFYKLCEGEKIPCIERFYFDEPADQEILKTAFGYAHTFLDSSLEKAFPFEDLYSYELLIKSLLPESSPFELLPENKIRMTGNFGEQILSATDPVLLEALARYKQEVLSLALCEERFGGFNKQAEARMQTISKELAEEILAKSQAKVDALVQRLARSHGIEVPISRKFFSSTDKELTLCYDQNEEHCEFAPPLTKEEIAIFSLHGVYREIVEKATRREKEKQALIHLS